ncbi:MAG: hypothetical protein ACYT04_78395, partial [Nostoc sp.]
KIVAGFRACCTSVAIAYSSSSNCSIYFCTKGTCNGFSKGVPNDINIFAYPLNAYDNKPKSCQSNFFIG